MPVEKNVLYHDRRLLRNQQLGAIYAASLDLESFDFTGTYAYSQLADCPLAERSGAAMRFAEKLAQKNLDQATIRTILETQGVPLPPPVVWLTQGSPKCDLRHFRDHGADLAFLRHPNLALVYDVWEEDGAAWFAWQPLEDYAPAGERPVAPDAALRQFRGILEGATWLHGHGLAHGDVRPDNLWLAADGQGAVLLAAALRPAHAVAATSDNFTAALFGYAAPETLRGEEPTPASDVYSLGACLWRLCSGAQPFASASSLSELLTLQDGARPFAAAREGIPEKLLAVIDRATAPEPSDRYQDAAAFGEDLDRYLAGGEPLAWQAAHAVSLASAGVSALGASEPDDALPAGGDAPAPAPQAAAAAQSVGGGGAAPAGPAPFSPQALGADIDRTGRRVWRNIAIAAGIFLLALAGAFSLGKNKPKIAEETADAGRDAPVRSVAALPGASPAPAPAPKAGDPATVAPVAAPQPAPAPAPVAPAPAAQPAAVKPAPARKLPRPQVSNLPAPAPAAGIDDPIELQVPALPDIPAVKPDAAGKGDQPAPAPRQLPKPQVRNLPAPAPVVPAPAAAAPAAPAAPAGRAIARPGWSVHNGMMVIDAALDALNPTDMSDPLLADAALKAQAANGLAAPAANAQPAPAANAPAAPAPEPAPTATPAAAALARGHALMKKKDYAAALKEFEAAQAAAPSDEAEGMITAAKVKIAQEKRKRQVMAEAEKLMAENRHAEAETALMQGLSAAGLAQDADLAAALKKARAGKFAASIAEGEKFLAEKNWKEAELAFAWALSVEGFADDARALEGRKKAQDEIARSENEKTARERERQELENRFNAAIKETKAQIAAKNWKGAQEVLNLALAVPGFADHPEAKAAQAAIAAGQQAEDAARAAAADPAAKAETARRHAELMRRGSALLKAEMWVDAEKVYSRALSLPGYAGDEKTLAARKQAIAGRSAEQKAAPAEQGLLKALAAASAGRLSESARLLAEAAPATRISEQAAAKALRNYLKSADQSGENENNYRAAFDAAREQSAAGKYLDAANSFGEAAAHSAAPAVLQFQRGLMLAMAGDDAEALRAFQDARARDPKLAAAVLAEALAAIAAQKYDVAMRQATAYADLARTPSERNWSKVTLGWLYYDGGAFISQKRELIEVNNEKAAPLFAEAAGADSPEGLCDMAICYLTGRGIRRNAAEARSLLEQAGELPEALFNAGLMYFRGTGTPRDYEKAAQYFERAAARGFARANARLADMYQRGRGVPKDPAAAARHLKAAGGQIDRDDDFVVALPSYATLYAAAKTVPLPPAAGATGSGDARVAFAPAYAELMATAKRQTGDGRYAAAARTYALALSLPGYAQEPAADRGLKTVNQYLATLHKAMDAPVAASEVKLRGEAALPEPPPVAPAGAPAPKTGDADADLMAELNNALGLPADGAAPAPVKTAPGKSAAGKGANDGDKTLEELLAALNGEQPPAKAAAPALPPAPRPAGEPTPEREAFYRQAVDESRKMLSMHKPGYAEQGFQMALVIAGVKDDSAAAQGLNAALEDKRKAGDKIKFTDFEAVLSSANAQMRERQWIAAANLYKYALSLDGCADEPLAKLGQRIAEYELKRQMDAAAAEAAKDVKILKVGSERDTASYNIAMTQARQFMSEKNYQAAAQLLKNVLAWDDFKDDPGATAMLKMAEEAMADNATSPEYLAKQREKNKEIYDKLIFSGKVYLENKQWKEAEQNFTLALKLKGYADDEAALRGRDAARDHRESAEPPASPQVRAEFLAMLNEARSALSTGQYVKAEEICRLALELKGCEHDEDGLAMLEAACKAQGKKVELAPKGAKEQMHRRGFVTTENELERAAARNQYEALVKEGRKMMAEKQYEIAEKIFQEVLKLRGFANDPTALELLQQAADAKPKAVEVTVPETPAPPDPGEENAKQAELLAADGRRMRAARNWAMAAQRFGDAIALTPDNASYYLLRGEAEMNRNQLPLALTDFRKALDLGTLSGPEKADAYNYVANIHYHGEVKDYPAAFQNYQKAAEFGNAAAMNSLGVAYFTGRGVDADKERAIEWYKKAAAAGYGNAMLNLGLSYDNGWGVEASPTEAKAWYEKAAEKQVPRAYARLARIYREGLGVPADPAKADEYAAQAKAHGYTADK